MSEQLPISIPLAFAFAGLCGRLECNAVHKASRLSFVLWTSRACIVLADWGPTKGLGLEVPVTDWGPMPG